MKQIYISLIIVLGSPAIFSQTNAGLPNPTYLNHLYLMDRDSLISLEQVDAHYMMKPPIPFAKNEAGLSMPGDKSMTRVKQADTLRFVIRLSSSMMDPAQVLRLYNLRVKKGNREAVLGSSQDMYYHHKNEDNSGGLPLHVQKSGNDVFVLIPASRLATGEYAFMNTLLANGGGPHAVYTLYAFGIDP